MKKVFNINEIDKLINELSAYYNLNEYNFYNKNALKFLKDFIKTNHAIDDINEILSEEDFNNLIKKFFPLKFASLEGTDFKTKRVYYSDEDLKVHWVVITNNDERHFKLKTNEICSRIEEYVIPWFNKIKVRIDKLYGYWFERTDDCWFITDMNKNKDGSYRIVAMNKNSLEMDKQSNSFGIIRGIADLHIIEE